MSDDTETTDSAQAPQPSVSIITQGVQPVKAAQILLTAQELAAVLQAGAQLVALVEKIKTDQADAWAAVQADFSESVAAFEAAAPAFAGYNDASALSVGQHVQDVSASPSVAG